MDTMRENDNIIPHPLPHPIIPANSQRDSDVEVASGGKKNTTGPITEVPELSFAFGTLYSELNVQVTRQDEKFQYTRPSEHMWLVSTLVDLIIWCVGFGVFLWCVLGTDDISDRKSSINFRFWVTVVFLSVEFAIIIILSIILIKYRRQPEIRCHNGLFMGQIVLCTYTYMIIAIVRTFGRAGVGAFSGFFSMDYEIWAAVFTIWTYFGLVSAFVMRLRMIYKVFTTSRVQTQLYWLLFHFSILVIGALPTLVCSYGGYKCSTAEYYAGVWFMWILFLIECVFYLNAVRPVPGLFVDFWSNVRLVLAYFLTFTGMCFYTIQYGHNAPTVVTDMVILAANLILITWFELFGYRTIKVVAREFNLKWLRYADLQGVSSFLLTDDHRGIAFILADPFLYARFEKMAKNGFYYENLAFCKAWSVAKSYQGLERTNAVASIITRFITAAEDPSMRLNVGGNQRDIIMEEFAQLKTTRVVSPKLIQTLDEVEQLVLTMMQQHIGRLLNQKEVVEYCQRVIAMVKARIIVPLYTDV